MKDTFYAAFNKFWELNVIEYINNLIDKIDYSNYNLIVKLHPLSKIDISDQRVIIDKKFTSVEMMIVSDYVITDYSAIVFEAAILEKPIFFYCYDYDKYYKKRNFYEKGIRSFRITIYTSCSIYGINDKFFI